MEIILDPASKIKSQDLKNIQNIAGILHAIDTDELIKKKLLHVQAEAFWTERFTYFDRKGQACELWSNVPQHQVELIKYYAKLIETLKSRIRGIKPNSTENDMLISFLDAGFFGTLTSEYGL